MAFKRAFTIVELLVVITVIAILVSLSIVGYSSISSKASVASLQTDLINAAKQLKLYNAQNGYYPTTSQITCTNPTSTQLCLTSSNGNALNYTSYPAINPTSFYLTNTNGTTVYQVTESGTPGPQTAVVGSGLVANLDAGNSLSYGGSGTLWSDLSGNGYNATLIGTTYSSLNGGGMYFDGVSSYATINQYSTSSAFTVEVILKPIDVTKDQMFFGPSASSDSAFYGRISGSHPYLSIRDTGYTQRTFTSSATLVNNTIYDIALSYNGQQSKIYTNGVLSSNAAAERPTLPWGVGRIGRWLDADQRSFVGYIYIMNVYNRDLSQAEVIQNFNALRSRYGI